MSYLGLENIPLASACVHLSPDILHAGAAKGLTENVNGGCCGENRLTWSFRCVCVCRKGRRKDKDSPTPPISDEQKQYLEESCLRQRVIDADFVKLVQLPPSLDCNEWLATHSEYMVSLEAANNVTVTGTGERERERERERELSLIHI